ncbi:19589_t:CDS:2 [Gigaspora margarita]|uniref:19589_t:CDS:1 n=1 Tax=Gigaspora margarita TaxID=4874 RepID=A0ABM8VWK0_GIGMA|nr:19589_t:CDS:2 [Gigaspora margarita]
MLIYSFASDAATEFDYIDLNFKPNLKELKNEICPQHLRQEVLDLIKMHFNQYSKVPVNAISLWFDDFKKQWKLLASKPVDADAENYYIIDLTHWVCSCKSFLNSRFLICKHLVCRAIEKEKLYNSEGIRLVYSNFEQNTDYPFLTLKSSSNNLQNQHFNKQPFNEQSINEQPLNEQSLIEQPLNVNNKLSTQANIKNDLIITDENDENFDPNLHQQCKSKIVILEQLVKHLNDELSANNLQHVKNIVDNMKRTFTIIEDIESSQCKR